MILSKILISQLLISKNLLNACLALPDIKDTRASSKPALKGKPLIVEIANPALAMTTLFCEIVPLPSRIILNNFAEDLISVPPPSQQLLNEINRANSVYLLPLRHGKYT